MLYEEARVYLAQVSKYGSVLGLDSIRELLKRLGNPQDTLQFIHIAGTNGKGSVLAYLSTILKEAGYKVGRYSSPTVMDYMERFQIGGKSMSEEKLGAYTELVKAAAEAMAADGLPSPTVFEIETAIAFSYFATEKCQIVVLETGLGGLLDATNIVKSTKVCVFTSISRDHVGILGENLEEIARNKAGIIKSGAAVVTVPQREMVMEVLQKEAEEKKCSLSVAEPQQIICQERSLEGQHFSYKEYEDMTIHLLGNYQLENVSIVLEVISVLRKMGMEISEQAVKCGLERTEWKGRFQILQKEPLVIVDGAHNKDAVKRLVENIEIYLKRKNIIAIMGVFKDKEYQEMVKLISPYLEKVYAVELPDRERTLSKERLKAEFEKYKVTAVTEKSHLTALRRAMEEAEKNQVILGFGSLSYLGDMIRDMRKEDLDGSEEN